MSIRYIFLWIVVLTLLMPIQSCVWYSKSRNIHKTMCIDDDVEFLILSIVTLDPETLSLMSKRAYIFDRELIVSFTKILGSHEKLYFGSEPLAGYGILIQYKKEVAQDNLLKYVWYDGVNTLVLDKGNRKIALNHDNAIFIQRLFATPKATDWHHFSPE